MSIKSVQNLISPLFLGVDQSPKSEIVVTRDQSMKEEAEALLSHFGIYLEVRFRSVVWEAFTDYYRTNMKAFQYCSLRKCAVERTTATDILVTSTTATDNSTNSFDHDFVKWGLTKNLHEVSYKI